MAIENQNNKLGDSEWGTRLDYFQAGNRVIELLEDCDPESTFKEVFASLDQIKADVSIIKDLVEMPSREDFILASEAGHGLEIRVCYDMDKDLLLEKGAPALFKTVDLVYNDEFYGAKFICEYALGNIERDELSRQMKAWLIDKVKEEIERVLKTSQKERGDMLRHGDCPFYAVSRDVALESALGSLIFHDRGDLDYIYPLWKEDAVKLVVEQDNTFVLGSLANNHLDFIKSSPELLGYISENPNSIPWPSFELLVKEGCDFNISLERLQEDELKVENYVEDYEEDYSHSNIYLENCDNLINLIVDQHVKLPSDREHEVKIFRSPESISSDYPYAVDLQISHGDDYDSIFGSLISYPESNPAGLHLDFTPEGFSLLDVKNNVNRLNKFKKGLTYTFWVTALEKYDPKTTVANLTKAFNLIKSVIENGRDYLGLDKDVDLNKFQMRVELMESTAPVKMRWLRTLD